MFDIIFLFIVFVIVSNIFNKTKTTSRKPRTMTFEGKEINIDEELKKFKRMGEINKGKVEKEESLSKPIQSSKSLEGRSQEHKRRIPKKRKRLEVNSNKINSKIYIEDISLEENKFEYDKEDLKEDVLKGIIFSEILGKPKSFRK